MTLLSQASHIRVKFFTQNRRAVTQLDWNSYQKGGK